MPALHNSFVDPINFVGVISIIKKMLLVNRYDHMWIKNNLKSRWPSSETILGIIKKKCTHSIGRIETESGEIIGISQNMNTYMLAQNLI